MKFLTATRLFLVEILRNIFSYLDIMVAWVIDQIYKLIMLIADTNLFGEKAIKAFSTRIYALLAIIMLFKIAFSLITFLVNPEEFHSKEKGGKKLITHVMIVLVSLILSPYFFTLLYDLQGLLLKNHVVDRIILGVGHTEENEDKLGKALSFSVFSSFFSPNTEIRGMEKCEGIYFAGKVNDDCKNLVNSASKNQAGDLLAAAVEEKRVSYLFDGVLMAVKKDDGFLFDYKILISTVVGAIVAYILIGIAIDISVRAIKLGFLQLIAPIPIISFLDPKSSKDGVFRKWLSNVMKTFLDLFIRLAAVFFSIFIISLLTSTDTEISLIGTIRHPIFSIFIILGALIFAGQLPKLISDLTGIKFDGDMSLNPLKKITSSPFAGAAIGGAVGAGASMLGAGMAARAAGANKWKTLATGLGGGFKGMFKGGAATFGQGGKGSPIKAGLGTSADIAGKITQRDGTTMGSRMKAKVSSALGMATQADIQDDKAKQYSDFLKLSKNIDERAESEVLKKPPSKVRFSWTTTDGKNMTSTGNLPLLKNQVESLKQGGASATEISNAENAYRAALKQAKADYIDSGQDTIIATQMKHADEMIKADKNEAFTKVKESTGVNSVSRAEDLGTIKNTTEQAKVKLESSKEWDVAHKSRDAIGKKSGGSSIGDK